VPLNAIAGSGPADVWVVGNEGTVLRWNGKNWDRLVPVTEEHLHAVTVERGGAVWVGGTHGFIQKLR